jgi:hypothetical protein
MEMEMASSSDQPHDGAGRKRGRWLPAIGFAGALLMLTAAAHAVVIEPGKQYLGTVVACGTQHEAETLRGFVVSGEMDKATAYLAADDNSCAVAPVRFVVVVQVSATRNDPLGHGWKIVKIALPASEAYLLTTADLVAGQTT